MVLKGIYAGKPAMFQLWLLAGQSFVRSSPVIPDRNGNLCFVTRCIRQYNAIPRYDANDAVVVSHRDFPVPALAVAWLCSADPAAYLCIKRKVDTKNPAASTGQHVPDVPWRSH